MRKRSYFGDFYKVSIKDIIVLIMAGVILCGFFYGGYKGLRLGVRKYKIYAKERQERIQREEAEAQRIAQEERERIEQERKADLEKYKNDLISKLNEYYKPQKNGGYILPILADITIDKNGDIVYSLVQAEDSYLSPITSQVENAFKSIPKIPLPSSFTENVLVLSLLFNSNGVSIYESDFRPDTVPGYTKEEALKFAKEELRRQIREYWDKGSLIHIGDTRGWAIVDVTIEDGVINQKRRGKADSNQYSDNAYNMLNYCCFMNTEIPSALRDTTVKWRLYFKDKDVQIYPETANINLPVDNTPMAQESNQYGAKPASQKQESYSNRPQRVYIGSYQTQSQAETAKAIVEASGVSYSPVVKIHGGYYTLQVGVYSSREKAQQIVDDLRNHNIPARIEVE